MPKPPFFKSLGMFVADQFLAPQECRQLCGEMRASESMVPATVIRAGEAEMIDLHRRSTKVVRVSTQAKLLIQQYFAALKPRLEAHFQLPLTGWEKPQFLRYGPGDFFGVHCDRNDNSAAEEYLQQRQISIVIFLNQPVNDLAKSQPDSTYRGGELTLYGLIQTPEWSDYGFSLIPEPGLLIAFRSGVPHEVMPVMAGERYTIVTWFQGLGS
jgi:predicted 2-oxoglutarate/Fe(II)-dependent dioxygenase YbiX